MLNGRCNSDRNAGKFTFNSHANIYKQIAELSVGDPNIISDHSILNFTLPVSVVNEEADYYMQEDVFESVNYKYVWKTENIDIFKNNLSGSSVILNGVQQSLLTDQFDNECIDEAVYVLVKLGLGS